MTDDDDSKTPDVKWTHVTGGIQREGGMTIFSLNAQGGSSRWGQRIEVETARFARSPGLYKWILDHMVRDIGQRL